VFFADLFHSFNLLIGTFCWFGSGKDTSHSVHDFRWMVLSQFSIVSHFKSGTGQHPLIYSGHL